MLNEGVLKRASLSVPPPSWKPPLFTLTSR